MGAALQARQAQFTPGQPLKWVFQCRQPDGPISRPVTTVMAGTVPEPHVVTEDGSRYRVQVQRPDVSPDRALKVMVARG